MGRLALKTALFAAAATSIFYTTSCKQAQPAADTSAVKNDAAATTGGNSCDTNAMRQRSQATFERTTDCAADAVSAGIAGKFKLAGEALADTKRIVDTLKAVGTRIGLNVTNLSSARAILCVRALGDYVTAETVKDIINTSSATISPDEKASIEEQLTNGLASSFSVGVTEAFQKYGRAAEQPTVENITAFIVALSGSVGNIGQFVTACGSVALDFGAVALPSVAKYSSAFGNVGTVGSIVKCSMAVIGNATDLATELGCLGRDMEILRQQYAALKAASQARCEGLREMIALPGFKGQLEGGDEESKGSACFGLIHRWGACLYANGVNSCQDCVRLCTAYVNAAGPNRHLQPKIDAAARSAGVGDEAELKRLVFQASSSCLRPVMADNIRPCVNYCVGMDSNRGDCFRAP